MQIENVAIATHNHILVLKRYEVRDQCYKYYNKPKDSYNLHKEHY